MEARVLATFLANSAPLAPAIQNAYLGSLNTFSESLVEIMALEMRLVYFLVRAS